MSRNRLSSTLVFPATPQPELFGQPLTIELLTPMIGGGTRSWQVDENQPIRPSEIKQQLRFWWRAMQDPATELKALAEQESALFGNTDGASSVRLAVKFDPIGKDQRLVISRTALVHGQVSCPKYVLFPFLGQKDKNEEYIPEFTLLHNFSFKLSLTTVSGGRLTKGELESLRNAVQLWLLFGGLGARTRRGAGSLYCAAVHDRYADESVLLEFISRALPQIEGGEHTAPFPSLLRSQLVRSSVPPNTSVVTAWDSLLGNHVRVATPPGYGDLRQAIGLAREQGREKTKQVWKNGKPTTVKHQPPGRSHWPEADALRSLTGRCAKLHQPRPDPGEWYPRAALGLPIQFKFDPDSVADGDPDGDYFLVPADSKGKEGRWPSPVILKIVRAGNKLFKVGLALNHATPKIKWVDGAGAEVLISKNAQPEAHFGKKLPKGTFPIPPGHPYDGLFTRLFPKTPVHVL